MIATRSPALTPCAISPLATDLISSSNSFAVTPCQPAPIGREMTIRSGVFVARVVTTRVRLPVAASGAIWGVETSIMGRTLSGEGNLH